MRSKHLFYEKNETSNEENIADFIKSLINQLKKTVKIIRYDHCIYIMIMKMIYKTE